MSSETEVKRRTAPGWESPQHGRPVSADLQRVLDSMAELSRNPAKAPEIVESGAHYEIVKPSR